MDSRRDPQWKHRITVRPSPCPHRHWLSPYRACRADVKTARDPGTCSARRLHLTYCSRRGPSHGVRQIQYFYLHTAFRGEVEDLLSHIQDALQWDVALEVAAKGSH